MFVILGDPTPALWLSKAATLRDRGGMALVIVHPDYMSDESRFDAYARYLDMVASDPHVWAALPRSVAAWWRRRAARLSFDLTTASGSAAGRPRPKPRSPGFRHRRALAAVGCPRPFRVTVRAAARDSECRDIAPPSTVHRRPVPRSRDRQRRRQGHGHRGCRRADRLRCVYPRPTG